MPADSTQQPPALDDLLGRHDEDFVRVAYEVLLGRTPESAEIEHWLNLLRSGTLSKIDALIAIRYSPEGRSSDVRIPGLAARRLAKSIESVPIIGFGAQWLRHLLLLPRLARRIRAIESSVTEALYRERELTAHALASLAAQLRRIDEAKAEASDVERSIAEIAGRMRRIDEAKAEASDVARSVAEIAEQMRRIDEAKADVGALAQFDARIESLVRDVTSVEDVLRRWGMVPPNPAVTGARDEFEAFYRGFEDRFRGTREAIGARLAFYLPMLRHVARANRAGSSARFIDLGCGRGELLQLLKENGLAGYGIDQSATMVSLCRSMGVEAFESDALTHLQSLASDSCAGILAIHMIEHLPYRTALMVFAEALRVLRPGGIAVFETPNPENLIVGACNFHFDPTHVRPLPPDPTRFALESIGFERVTIERLHPGATPEQAEAVEDRIAKLYLTLMLVPQDYALIAYKPSGRERSAEVPAS